MLQGAVESSTMIGATTGKNPGAVTRTSHRGVPAGGSPGREIGLRAGKVGTGGEARSLAWPSFAAGVQAGGVPSFACDSKSPLVIRTAAGGWVDGSPGRGSEKDTG